MKAENLQRRLTIIALCIFFVFTLLIFQFYRIQIMEGSKWLKLANAQHHLVIKEPFKRGVFYSNSSINRGHLDVKQPLVIDVPKFHLYIDPLAIKPPFRQEMIGEIASFLQLSQEEKLKLHSHFAKESRSRRIKTWLDHEKRKEILAWWKPFASRHHLPSNALFFTPEYQRCYPFGKLLGQVLHTIREERDAITNQGIPTGGLENSCHHYLSGKEGKRILLRSPLHPLDTGKLLTEPEDGADVYLTINHHLQAIAEEEIEKGVRLASAKSGWAVIMDPHTGEIYALAQYPFFFPEKYRDYFNDPSLIEHTRLKALTDCFEPGSTMKPISLAIALLANEECKKRGKPLLFDPAQMMRSDQGMLPGRLNPMKDLSPRSYLNMNMALQKSSNIYVAQLISKVVDTLGEAWYRDCLESLFGFGVKTGLELPGENPGLLPTPHRFHPSGHPEWSKSTPCSLAIGYNLLANTIQVLRAHAIIANGGHDIKPSLIRKVQKGDQIIYLSETSSRQVLSSAIAHHIVRAMKFTTKPGGSAVRADISGYTEAGKTSTSEKIVDGQYSHTHHIATFVGFAPAFSPRLILMVCIDEPAYRFLPGIGYTHYGGKCAAPTFKHIMEKSLRYLGIPPDDPHSYPGNSRPEAADWFKEVQELKALGEKWNA